MLYIYNFNNVSVKFYDFLIIKNKQGMSLCRYLLLCGIFVIKATRFLLHKFMVMSNKRLIKNVVKGTIICMNSFHVIMAVLVYKID